MKNWKTTGIGFLSAVWALVQGGLTWKAAVTAVLVQSLGLFAKDFDKSHSKDPGEAQKA